MMKLEITKYKCSNTHEHLKSKYIATFASELQAQLWSETDIL